MDGWMDGWMTYRAGAGWCMGMETTMKGSGRLGKGRLGHILRLGFSSAVAKIYCKVPFLPFDVFILSCSPNWV